MPSGSGETRRERRVARSSLRDRARVAFLRASVVHLLTLGYICLKMLVMNSDQIRALRRARGWTQERLAEQINVSRQSVHKWESGKATPSRLALKALLELEAVTG